MHIDWFETNTSNQKGLFHSRVTILLRIFYKIGFSYQNLDQSKQFDFLGKLLASGTFKGKP